MLDDGSVDLFGGIWPFIRRFLIVFLPLWLFLILHNLGVNVIISAIISGASASTVVVFEKFKLRQENTD
ncbi:MAG: hypothetical protein CMB24_00365 [Euryarchaeota archaeon]|jgi:hypothetical protein|nr:hypothetical protein [Euryarchaeota archaeon]